MNRALIRVVVVELADAEDAATALARTLRDEGVEVIYAGRLHTAEQIVRTVEQEDPDVLGVVGDDPALTAAAAAELSGMPVFALGPARPDVAIPVVETTSEATDWVARVASHITESPSDRAR
ncbi:hypothetical protein [Amycolatopsis anabasis]|uniref:hypothetical protein n=1 Tax=Amycolatopsis anabasis TaxID=1840409 RepID=UPI00131A9B70|nr:hypothetical protein [Amycolatopsis anabasis]